MHNGVEKEARGARPEAQTDRVRLSIYRWLSSVCR